MAASSTGTARPTRGANGSLAGASAAPRLRLLAFTFVLSPSGKFEQVDEPQDANQHQGDHDDAGAIDAVEQ